jgi:hypothetical protein
MTYTPGMRAATTLLECGLNFDAVVRGLIAEIGMSPAEAIRATSVATSARAIPDGMTPVWATLEFSDPPLAFLGRARLPQPQPGASVVGQFEINRLLSRTGRY